MDDARRPRDNDEEEKSCPTCGRDNFSSVSAMKMHHVRTHGESIAGLKIECDFCGKETRKRPKQVRGNEHHFCDNVCYRRWRSRHLKTQGGKQWSSGPETVNCHFCGAEIKRYLYEINNAERNFCDAACRGAWRSANWTTSDFPRWSGGPLSVQCQQCGKTFERKRCEVTNSKRNFCSRSCFGEWRSGFQRGKNNPSWTGGAPIRVAVRNLIGDQPWTVIANEHRKDKCENCGKWEPSDGRALSVHHIIPVMAGGCNEGELLMALCNGCHRKAETFTRKYVEPVLIDG